MTEPVAMPVNALLGAIQEREIPNVVRRVWRVPGAHVDVVRHFSVRRLEAHLPARRFRLSTIGEWRTR